MQSILLLLLVFSFSALADEPKVDELRNLCIAQLNKIPGKVNEDDLKKVCAEVKQPLGCESTEGTPIYYFERKGSAKEPKKIFAKALIHGDETQAGAVARAWMLRLSKIEPRNTWRVIAIANPDGWKAKTRYNHNGVDLNRNFPTEGWEEQAIAYWKKEMHSDKRRYPGSAGASEVETKCLIKQFEEFKPDFIISVHTPLGVLDLDGPKVKQKPSFNPLPWQSLGNFPGSLGRYMWKDRGIPVLTIELKGDQGIRKLDDFDRLQDISGTIAIQASKIKALEKTSTAPKF